MVFMGVPHGCLRRTPLVPRAWERVCVGGSRSRARAPRAPCASATGPQPTRLPLNGQPLPAGVRPHQYNRSSDYFLLGRPPPTQNAFLTVPIRHVSYRYNIPYVYCNHCWISAVAVAIEPIVVFVRTFFHVCHSVVTGHHSTLNARNNRRIRTRKWRRC